MAGTDFFSDVYQVVRLIPGGRATSYGAIAACLGAPGNARIVGWAMAGCPGDVPAHRVVNSKGQLSAKARFGPGNEMQHLLEAEGVQVVNDRIADWGRVFWDPAAELL